MVFVPVPLILDIVLGLDSPVTVNVKSLDTALTGSENDTVTVSDDVTLADVTEGI